ncbi:MAG: dihydroorotate dehydrogenase [Candidatus Jordarchaeales archaeon]
MLKEAGRVMVNLEVEVSGLRLRNPVMLASGVIGVTGKLLVRAAEAGAGAVVTKSVGLERRTGYGNPTIVEVAPGSYVNCMGLPNPGIDEFAEEIRIAKKGGVPVVVSVFGSSPEEFAMVAEKAEDAGGDAVELNVSCPHAEVGVLERSPRIVGQVVEAVKRKVGVPVFVKLSSNVTSIVEVGKAAEDAGADAVTAINTVRAMVIDVEACRPILSNRFGGLSGVAIKPIAVRCVYELYETLKIPVIGVGGIFSWEDAVEHILAGASAVQVATALTRGFNVFKEVVDGIRSYLERKGFRDIREVVGAAHR